MKFVKHRIPNLEIKKQLEDWLHIKILGNHVKVPEGNSKAVKNFIIAKLEENTKIHKDFLERIIDEVHKKHESPVPPDPVLSRLDKIIELLEALVKI